MGVGAGMSSGEARYVGAGEAKTLGGWGWSGVGERWGTAGELGEGGCRGAEGVARRGEGEERLGAERFKGVLSEMMRCLFECFAWKAWRGLNCRHPGRGRGTGKNENGQVQMRCRAGAGAGE